MIQPGSLLSLLLNAHLRSIGRKVCRSVGVRSGVGHLDQNISFDPDLIPMLKPSYA